MSWLRTFCRRLVNTFLGVPCERCGCRGASLVLDAVPAGKRLDGRRGLVVKTFKVHAATWLCLKCRAASNPTY